MKAAVAASLAGPAGVAAAMALGLRGLGARPAGDRGADDGPEPAVLASATGDVTSAG